MNLKLSGSPHTGVQFKSISNSISSANLEVFLSQNFLSTTSSRKLSSGESENINSYEDVIEFRKKANASSVMLARAARDNCSIFRAEGKLDRNIVIGEYLDLCMKYENYFSITKFTVQCMMGFVHEGTGNAEFHASTNMRDLWWVYSFSRWDVLGMF